MKVDPSLPQELRRAGEFDAGACLNCGSCTALCPVGLAILPRRIFRYALLGARARIVEETDAIFSCLLCRLCEQNCPAGVPITGNLRTLRVYLGREELGLAPAEA